MDSMKKEDQNSLDNNKDGEEDLKGEAKLLYWNTCSSQSKSPTTTKYYSKDDGNGELCFVSFYLGMSIFDNDSLTSIAEGYHNKDKH